MSRTASPGRNTDPGASPSNVGGFQLALRVGVGVPASANSSDFFAPQATFLVDAGVKFNKNVFIGGYVGLGFGTTQPDLCTFIVTNPKIQPPLPPVTCTGQSATAFRIGFQVQYHVQPNKLLNPWIGGGVGLEGSGGSIDSHLKDPLVPGTTPPNVPINISLFGAEVLRIMGGLDVRLSKTFAIGPVADFVIGRYTRFDLKFGDQPNVDVLKNDDGRYGYVWITLGARAVLFP